MPAREQGRRESAPSARDLWEGVLRGEWTIVDHADRGGRRLFVVRRNRREADSADGLTKREQEVVSYAAGGHSLKFISYELGVSVSTISTHLKHALFKLRLRDRAELARALRGRAIGGESPELFAHRSVVGTDELATFELVLAEPDSGEAFASLTAAEKSVVGLLLEGRSNAAIACSRHTSVNTVGNQIASIYRKLDVVSRSELYALVARQG